MISIYSHPGEFLTDHLRRVSANNTSTLLARKFDFFNLPTQILADLGLIAGAVHDIGKATKNFQHYLATKEIIGNKNHALISAFAGYFLAVQYLEQYDFEEEELKIVLAYFVFIAVKRHHGNLQNFETELSGLTEQEGKLPDLIDNFYAKEAAIIVNERVASLKLTFDWIAFSDFVKSKNYLTERQDFAINYINNDEERSLEESIRNFYLHQIIYASLLFADKSDVILKSDVKKGQQIDFDAVTKYRIAQEWTNPTAKINIEKNKAYQTSLAAFDTNFLPNKHLYSVTMPTGLGKTVTSFALALQLMKRLNNPASRIVITIPFTSIIDQNYEVYSDILQQPTSAQLLKHHHLAEPKYNTNDEDTVRDENESQFLIETWQSQVVVTTFVQLLECLFTNDKSKLMKLPNLANSIIILDEIQNIAYKYWKPIRAAFQLLGEQMNCYFILMSATQPLIFDPNHEIRELIPNYQSYFNFFNRTKLINKMQEVIPLDMFTDEVVDYFEAHPKHDILIILNSVNVTRQCFSHLLNQIDENQANLYYLSTRITPYERKEIIKLIKNPTNSKPNIIVSTQLIEAGVDISVNTVFRAMAPLDSIIQAAGRANRYWENKDVLSEVFLYKIEELEKANALIYGGTLLLKTERVLGDFTAIEEKDYLKLIEKYFLEIKKQADNSKDEIVPRMEKLEFKNVGEFQFIPERATNSIFVQLNATAKKIWNKYVRLAEDKTLKSYERKKKFAEFKAEFYDYIVNIPLPYKDNVKQEHIDWDNEPQHFFYVWEFDQPNHFYNYHEKSKDQPDFRQNIGYFPTTPTF